MAGSVEALQASRIVPGLQVPEPSVFSEVSYDADEDTLYVRTRTSHDTLTEPLHDGVWVSVDPDTNAVVGFDVEGFRETFLPEHPDVDSLVRGIGSVRPSDLSCMPSWLVWRVTAAIRQGTPAY